MRFPGAAPTVVGMPLHDTLTTLLRSGTDDNPALTALLNSYTEYHVVFLVIGGISLLALLPFTAWCWRRFAGSRVNTQDTTSFERRTYLGFALLGTALVLFLGVAMAANLSVVLDPRPGFSSAVGVIGPPAGSRSAALQDAFTTWLRSGSARMPEPVSRAIHDRLAWQGPKAVICALLLVALVALSVAVWRRLVRNSRIAGAGRRAGRRAGLLAVGVPAVAACLVLAAMVIGNTEAGLAPTAMTLFYG